MFASSSPPPQISKRKLEDYEDEVDERNDGASPTLNPATRTRSHLVPIPHVTTHQSTCLQFFVRLISDKTLVVRAFPSDTVRSIYEKIEFLTKVRLDDQGLIYRGKQLQYERTLVECGIENDASLYFVGRMRSTGNPRAWQLINDVVSLVLDLQNNSNTTKPDETRSYNTDDHNSLSLRGGRSVKSTLDKYLSMMKGKDFDASGHLKVFYESSAVAALVMLYMSPVKYNKDVADEAIKNFIGTGRIEVPKQSHCMFVKIVLQFCKLLRVQSGMEDSLYDFCRRNLGAMSRECIEFKCRIKGPFWVKEIFPFVSELAGKLSCDLSLFGPVMVDVKDFADFLVPLRTEIENSFVLYNGGPIRLPLSEGLVNMFPVRCTEEVSKLYEFFLDLLGHMDSRMKSVEEHMDAKSKQEKLVLTLGWNQYLLILKELYGISKLYYNGAKLFGDVMKLRRSALNYLVLNHAKRSDDNKWIIQYKELTSFEVRRHLAMMVLPDMKDEYDELHEMLIDRSQLLSESFEYIAHAEPESLRSGLFMEFKNEEATGPGVLREWFLLVCQAIFNPENALFLACPGDRRRFYPNPASKVDPLHLDYFKLSGRVIALAILHKIQVGIVFDHVFFKQLAGDNITLEDIRDADPYIYNSCKQILEMDPEAVDQDALGLTFVHEIEELGTRKVIELCPYGRSIVVNSRNRKEYVDFLIRHLFVVSIAEQVANFAKGFADIASSSKLQKSFFQCLIVKDLDLMLYGSDKPICVDDWRAHTEYRGFKQSDDLISWFWEIVASMSAEQKKTLLFFWTSLKYLPVEGFKGLASKLYIYKSSQNSNCLPSSHTCFYRLSLPSYPSCSYMRERLHIIAQEHVGCSFGTS